jgi:hypothetical protein
VNLDSGAEEERLADAVKEIRGIEAVRDARVAAIT